uniref:Uncharacterized protein n=1 Tax=Nelumbo nucifera TaxID=4432 RepID=A0A822ZH34_NELNU|nr:TPA_asm: hypothetical protein HUJ06_002437 [Nelumbo nucifera]
MSSSFDQVNKKNKLWFLQLMILAELAEELVSRDSSPPRLGPVINSSFQGGHPAGSPPLFYTYNNQTHKTCDRISVCVFVSLGFGFSGRKLEHSHNWPGHGRGVCHQLISTMNFVCPEFEFSRCPLLQRLEEKGYWDI